MVAPTTPAAREILDRARQLSTAEQEWIAFELLDRMNPPPNRFETKEALQAELKRALKHTNAARSKVRPTKKRWPRFAKPARSGDHELHRLTRGNR
ncbi:MAG: hypothetical protein U0792_13825 [Gemmataceae bacterium]